ncbi:aldolase citrate lyase family protein [Rutstroemia sp. NJR-2017a WRK4]|nr:aldolase citrate lyase family protein [Rutstroemia sp. NJR-2017a WRK4]
MGDSQQSSHTQGMQAYRAPSLLQPHRARDALRDAHDGKIPPLIGFFCGLASPPISKIAAQLGYDIVWVDWEHAAMSVETMTQMVHDVQFISEGKSMAFVRVPGHDHAAIGYALDAGASIVVPQVDTVEQAKHIVSAAKFGASRNGKRSAPPARYLFGISDTPLDPSLTLWESLNNQAAIVIQIESLEGIHNLDAILTECGEHIDSVWLGSLDARASMGLPGVWGDEKEWMDALKIYEGTLAKHDKPASGLALGTMEQKLAMGRGRSFMVSGSDVFTLTMQAMDAKEMKDNFKQMSYQGVYKAL